MKKMSEYDKILFISECRNDLMHSYKLSKYDSILILFDDHYTGITDRYMDLYNILRNISTTVNITMVFVRNDLGILDIIISALFTNNICDKGASVIFEEMKCASNTYVTYEECNENELVEISQIEQGFIDMVRPLIDLNIIPEITNIYEFNKLDLDNITAAELLKKGLMQELV